MLGEVCLELNKVSKNPGIYCILNIANSKIYIGSSNNVSRRIADHRRDLCKNVHVNKHLQSAWNKYGESNFKFILIEEHNIEDLLSREQYYLDKYKSYNKEIGYNKSVTAKGHTPSAFRTHCKNGHELSGDNILLRQRARLCRKCINEYKRSRRIKVKIRKKIEPKELCQSGHKMTEENAVISICNKRGKVRRHCRICRNKSKRELRLKNQSRKF